MTATITTLVCVIGILLVSLSRDQPTEPSEQPGARLHARTLEREGRSGRGGKLLLRAVHALEVCCSGK